MPSYLEQTLVSPIEAPYENMCVCVYCVCAVLRLYECMNEFEVATSYFMQVHLNIITLLHRPTPDVGWSPLLMGQLLKLTEKEILRFQS